MPTDDYKEHLLKELEDRDYAAGYLTAALEEGEAVFLLALRDVAQAHGGMAGLAQATKLNRENLYDMLSEAAPLQYHRDSRQARSSSRFPAQGKGNRSGVTVEG